MSQALSRQTAPNLPAGQTPAQVWQSSTPVLCHPTPKEKNTLRPGQNGSPTPNLDTGFPRKNRDPPLLFHFGRANPGTEQSTTAIPFHTKGLVSLAARLLRRIGRRPGNIKGCAARLRCTETERKAPSLEETGCWWGCDCNMIHATKHCALQYPLWIGRGPRQCTRNIKDFNLGRFLSLLRLCKYSSRLPVRGGTVIPKTKT